MEETSFEGMPVNSNIQEMEGQTTTDRQMDNRGTGHDLCNLVPFTLRRAINSRYKFQLFNLNSLATLLNFLIPILFNSIRFPFNNTIPILNNTPNNSCHLALLSNLNPSQCTKLKTIMATH